LIVVKLMSICWLPNTSTNRSAVASFYNLESQTWSNRIAATDVQLQVLEMDLFQIAQQHQEDLQRYKRKWRSLRRFSARVISVVIASFSLYVILPSSGAFTHDRVSCSARRSRQNCLSEIFLLGHDILNLVAFCHHALIVKMDCG